MDHSRPRLVLGAVIIIALFSSLLFSTMPARAILDSNFDLLLRLKASMAPRTVPPQQSPVAIIALDDKTLAHDKLSVPELFQHQYYLKIIKSLQAAGAKGVVLMRMLPRSGDTLSSQGEVRQWFDTMSRINKIMPVLSGILWQPHQIVIPSTDYFLSMAPENFGFLNSIRDLDSSVRRQMVTWPNCRAPLGCHSLVWRAATLLEPSLKNPGDEFLIDFDSRANSVPVYSFIEAYQQSEKGRQDYFNAFAGKLVLIGPINYLNRNSSPTIFSQSTGQYDTEVEIAAQAILTLTEGRQYSYMGFLPELILILAFVLAALTPLMFSPRFGPYYFLWWPSFLIPVYLGLSLVAFYNHHYLPPLTGISALALAQIFYLTVRASETKTATKTGLTALSLYINPALADEIVKHPELLTREGDRREMTIFFSDLVGFTSLAEQMTPESLVASLNRYFETMEPIIRAHGGILDKFDGDAIMAFWGSPILPRPDHAIDSCLAALDQREALIKLNKLLASEGQPPFSALMGLNTGPVVVGNIGTESRLNYTVMGDSVNLASRLVSVNKIYQTQIIVSGSTAASANPKIELRQLDRITVPGRSESLAIYEVLGRRGDLSDAQCQGRDLYESALKFYFRRDFQKALALFEATLSYIGDDGPAELMSARCREFMRIPPLDDWHGVSSIAIK